ncbi:MAG: xanthine dehydrogenase family protein subunit M [SAR324 cluster bacterium]|nr:xanthine dehydrogenase family protein subunit M [SAR324 cluster bacterium]
MYAESFEYHAPASLQEAVTLLGQYGDDAKIVTGGMSLIPIMKLRLAAPKHLIDLRKVGELKGISESGGNLTIGAGTTYYELESSKTVLDKCPLLAQTAAAVGDVQVRNRGTLGGSVVHNDPSADLPAALVALDAQLTLQGKSQRTVAIKDFLVDSLTTAIEPDEILVRITVIATGRNTCYAKMAQQASGFAVVGVAVALEMNGANCTGARVGVTGVSPTAFRAGAVERALAGKALDDGAIAAAAEQVAGDAKDPLGDPLNASPEYRLHLAKVFTRRAIEGARV